MKMTTRITRKSSPGTWPVGDTGDMMLKNSYIKLKTLTENNSKQKKSKLVPMIVIYSKHLPNIGEIVRRRLPILHRSEKMKVVFKEPSLTACRRARNIADICVHTKHRRQFNRETPGCFKCSKKCAVHICPFYGFDGSSYQIARKVTCDSRNVIYCISCTECSAPIYVRETGDRVYARMQIHFLG